MELASLEPGVLLDYTAKEREVIQLLKDYRSWKTAYGGAGIINLEAQGQFGPAGMILEGMAFFIATKTDPNYQINLKLLQESLELLEHALTILKAREFEAWLTLLAPYLGDPADPTLVDQWRKHNPGLLEWHDYAIEKLAEYLKHKDLYVVWPSRMTVRKPANVKERNDELFALYKRFRVEGETRKKAIEQAAEMCDYSRSQAYEIIRVREGRPKKKKAC